MAGMIGDLDKPFHRPECRCTECDDWRARHTAKRVRYGVPALSLDRIRNRQELLNKLAVAFNVSGEVILGNDILGAPRN